MVYILGQTMALVIWNIAITALLVIVDGVSVAVGCEYGLSSSCPGKSCLDIYHKNPNSHGTSQEYIIKIGNYYRIVHCDMNLQCGGEKGWMRVIKFNITDGDSCPGSAWRKITTPTKACRAAVDDAGCYSVYFTTHTVPYSRVCGMVIGYQKGTTEAFHPGQGDVSIDSHYLDGVSITYGIPRKHLWSYAAGLSEISIYDHVNCPCSVHHGALPPSFVRDNYYCESGTNGGLQKESYFTGDPLWDGNGCSSKDNYCAQPNLPWFYRQIPLTANDKLEARICYDQEFTDEAVLVKEIQLYVQ